MLKILVNCDDKIDFSQDVRIAMSKIVTTERTYCTFPPVTVTFHSFVVAPQRHLYLKNLGFRSYYLSHCCYFSYM